MLNTSEARANRAIRVLRGALRGTVAAGLVIAALAGSSGGIASAQSGPIVDDTLTDPGLPTSWREGRHPSVPGSEIGTFYGDDGFHISLHQDVVVGTDIRVGTVPFTSGSFVMLNENLDAALQRGGAGANQSIEVDATQVDGGVDNAYGVACRFTPTGGYVLWAGSDGTAGISKLSYDGSGGGTTVELARTNLPADSSYHLRTDCDGSRLAEFVNGAKIAEAQDGDFKSGHVGLYGGTNEASGIDVAFTNLRISRP